jgi:aspartate/methionine/tyrosine aminotransferase
MADEVYQENIYKKDAKFVSFRKIAYEMGAFDGPNSLQLVSFHSISKVRRNCHSHSYCLHYSATVYLFIT